MESLGSMEAEDVANMHTLDTNADADYKAAAVHAGYKPPDVETIARGSREELRLAAKIK